MKFITLLFALISSATVADEPGPEGPWTGGIEISGVRLGIEITLTKAEPWSGTISIPAQALKDFALSDVEVDGNQVSFAMKGIPGDPSFDGTLAADGKTIAGDFSQAAISAKISLKRKAAKPDKKTDPGSPKIVGKEASLDQRLERLISELEERREEFGIPGMAIAIVKDDKVVLARGFGVANKEDQTPVTPETLFAIGSSTKALLQPLMFFALFL